MGEHDERKRLLAAREARVAAEGSCGRPAAPWAVRSLRGNGDPGAGAGDAIRRGLVGAGRTSRRPERCDPNHARFAARHSQRRPHHLQGRAVRRLAGRRRPLEGAAEARAVDRRPRRARSTGRRRSSPRTPAGQRRGESGVERGLPRPQRLDAGHQGREAAARDVLLPRWRLRDRERWGRGLAAEPAPRRRGARPQPRRRGGHAQPPAGACSATSTSATSWGKSTRARAPPACSTSWPRCGGS